MPLSAFSLSGADQGALPANIQFCTKDSPPSSCASQGPQTDSGMPGSSIFLLPNQLWAFSDWEERKKIRSPEALSLPATLTHLSFSSLRTPSPSATQPGHRSGQNLTFHCPCCPEASPAPVSCSSPLSSNQTGGGSAESPGPPPVWPLPQASVSPPANSDQWCLHARPRGMKQALGRSRRRRGPELRAAGQGASSGPCPRARRSAPLRGAPLPLASLPLSASRLCPAAPPAGLRGSLSGCPLCFAPRCPASAGTPAPLPHRRLGSGRSSPSPRQAPPAAARAVSAQPRARAESGAQIPSRIAGSERTRPDRSPQPGEGSPGWGQGLGWWGGGKVSPLWGAGAGKARGNRVLVPWKEDLGGFLLKEAQGLSRRRDG